MADVNTNVTETVTTTAENNGGGPKGDAGNPTDTVSTSEGAEKTFTQKELDEIVSKRLAREAQKQPNKDEWKAFKAWQDSQKTAEQLSAEKIAAAESAQSAAEKRAEAAEAKNVAYSLGVVPEAVDDVIALAMVKVNDDVDINKAISGVLTKYPQFCKSGTVENKSISTGVNFSGGNSNTLTGVEAAFLAKNPGLKL